MQTLATGKLPDPLYRIQLGAVRRQEIQAELPLMRLPPLLMKTSMVIAGVVRDHHHLSAWTLAVAPQVLQKGPETDGIESIFYAAMEKTTIPQTNSTEVADALARGGMEQDRVTGFRRCQHPATGTVLLEMHLVRSPKVHRLILAQGLEFFYAPPAVPGRPERSPGVACGAGSVIAKTGTGIGACPKKLRSVARSKR
jgi:hypothetical protein